MIKQAFILAAGLGSRMRELTKEIPKPMITVTGQSLITRLIDQLIAHGVTRVIVNTFYKADYLIEHVKKHMEKNSSEVEIFFSKESELLDTGGGIVNALKYLNNEPFFVVNSDALFIGDENVFSFLNKNWDSSMKTLFLLAPLEKTIGHDGKGDFFLGSEKQLILPKDDLVNPSHVYISTHITRPEIFKDHKAEPVKLMEIYKKFLDNNILENSYGVTYPGQWLHVGTPEALDQATNFIANSNCK